MAILLSSDANDRKGCPILPPSLYVSRFSYRLMSPIDCHCSQRLQTQLLCLPILLSAPRPDPVAPIGSPMPGRGSKEHRLLHVSHGFRLFLCRSMRTGRMRSGHRSMDTWDPAGTQRQHASSAQRPPVLARDSRCDAEPTSRS